MPNNKELFKQKMDALANSINTKATTSGAKTIDQLKTAVDGIVPTGGYTINTNTYGDTIDILGRAAYSIITNITNGTASGATTISSNGTATITITADSGYKLPAVGDIVVTNATKGTFVEGVLTISNPTGGVTITAVCKEEPYLTFSSDNSFTLNTGDNTKHWDGTLEYSTDTTTWNTWPGTSAISSASDGTKHNLYLRGTGNTRITGVTAVDIPANWVLTGSNISCSGSIENLLDYTTVAGGNHPTMAAYCYRYMFKGCTSLTTAPVLPATTLPNGCYDAMFEGCTSLTTAPTLPATTLSTSCYNGMFYGCTSLTTAPTLPATTLANSCYSGMFYNCTSLTTVPTLPATTLRDFCYHDMFRGCTSLTTVPILPATKLRDWCYTGMFQGCTKIKLSTTQTGEYVNEYRIPTTGTGTTASYALTNMFSNTGGTFTGEPTINTTYYTSNIIVPHSSGSSI